MQEEIKIVFVTYKRDGADVGDYVDVPDGTDAEEFASSLMEDASVIGVYRSCTNAGPIDPIAERRPDGSIALHIRNDGAFSYSADADPSRFSEAYRDFVSRFEAGKLAPLRLDGNETDGEAFYAFPAMNGIYKLRIQAGKITAIALF